LGGTRVDGNVESHLEPLNKLGTFVVYGDWFADDDLGAMAKLPQLKKVSITSNAISNDGLAHLDALSKLTFLEIDSFGLRDDGLRHVGKLAGLERLVLNTSKPEPSGGVSTTDHISAAGFAHLEQLDELTSLDLFGIPLSTAGLSHLKQLPKLESLRIGDGTALDDGALEQLNQFPRLKYLEGISFGPDDEELYAALPGLFIYNP
jgi:hypothetical protein